MGQKEPDDFATRGFFGIEIDGVNVGTFRAADGLTVQREVVEYHEGGENSRTHKLLGPTRWSNITLSRGLTDNVEFYNWMKQTIEAQEISRKNGSIILYAPDGKAKMRWDFLNGWPCRWEGPRFESMEHEIAIETLEIAHDGFTCK